MAVYIGGRCRIDEISRDDFAAAAEEAGIGRRMALRRLDRLCDGFEEALKQAAGLLRDAGFANVTEIGEKILATGGYRRLL